MNPNVKTQQEDTVADWFGQFGWHGNPFTFKIYEHIMIGNNEKIKEIMKHIEAHSAFSLLIGETGAGKTNLLRWLYNQYQDHYAVHYLPKPPATVERLRDYLATNVLQQNIFTRQFSPLTYNNLHTKLQQKLHTKTILMIDEGHEASEDVLSWIRTIIDHVDSIICIAVGTPALLHFLQNNIPTLYNRAPSVMQLERLNKDETIELIRKRIEFVGGNGIEPFTYDALVKLYRHSNGLPRHILRLCHQSVIYAMLNQKHYVDDAVADATLSQETFQEQKTAHYQNVETHPHPTTSKITSKESESDGLSERQQEILTALDKLGEATPGELIDIVDTSAYQSKSHALRSVNNVLVRLMNNRYIDRKQKGRTYAYFVPQDNTHNIN